MREIKFRQPIFSGGFNSGNFYKWHYWGFISDGQFVSPSGTLENARKTSQQYTGLKDKNGKEIYEGDIVKVKVNDCIWLYEIKSVNEFGNNLFAVTRYRNFTINDNEEQIMGDYYFINDGWNHIPYRAEIIGNIYENKKLLM